MKVLISGGAGFIALHLADALAKSGHTVHLVDVSTPNGNDVQFHSAIKNPNIAFTQLDLCKGEIGEVLGSDFTHIVHLAAILGVQNVIANSERVLIENIQMTANLLQFSKTQKDFHQFLFASTSEVYAGTIEHDMLPLPTPETSNIILPDLAKPRTSYMLSKIYGEALCRQSGLPITIVRPHNIYGPRMGLKHVIPQLLQKAYLNTSGLLEVFSTNHTRTFCFIDDAVRILLSLMSNGAALGKTLNLGTQSPEVSMGDLANLIIEVLAKDLEVVPKAETEGSPKRRVPNTEMIDALSGHIERTNLKTGVEKTFLWYRENVFDNLMN